MGFTVLASGIWVLKMLANVDTSHSMRLKSRRQGKGCAANIRITERSLKSDNEGVYDKDTQRPTMVQRTLSTGKLSLLVVWPKSRKPRVLAAT